MLIFKETEDGLTVFYESDLDSVGAVPVRGLIRPEFAGREYRFYGYGTHSADDLRQIAGKLDELNSHDIKN